MDGVRREIGRDVHPIIPHPLGERNGIIEHNFSAPTSDIRPREPRKKFATIFTIVGRYHKFRSGGEVSIVFHFFWVDFTDICIGDAGIDTRREGEYVGFQVEQVGGTDSQAGE